MPDKPNILFILTDQHRGDALGADPNCPVDEDGYPLVHTPNLNRFVERGTYFSSAYTPAPSSIPARRCLWTGQTPATNGCTNWTTAEWSFPHTLPSELSNAGYQTRLTGKTHSLPPRNHFGFDQIVLHAGLNGLEDDYSEWLSKQGNGKFDEISHGVGRNSWDPRPSHLPEHLHPTNWTTNRALEFFDKRDPTRPFFHTVSYVRPHQPFDPPQTYWDMYVDCEMPDPDIGEWAEEMYRQHISDNPATDAWCADLSPTTIHRARAGYYASITHIDHQINRLLQKLRMNGELENTVVVFTSDHGEMLGDHLLWRKTYAYEGSARVPLLIRFPENMETDGNGYVTDPVGLEDIMPTILELADASVPETVEGRSLLSLIEGNADWREYYHGEHGPVYHDENAMQYLVSDQYKYVWNSVTGGELLFDLSTDPGELSDESDNPAYEDPLLAARQHLVNRLANHPFEYSDGKHLIPQAIDRPSV
ncbi:choline-sulfatase [Haladaptatus litoreus]|uniref:Choline-sulfatase n=1 Tax=Haladaptatus litoreus TaxID=553468 RepID=A0A1N7DF94_9EURY|nr:arylsulfatase [Haladaptatus litoreus]SIR74491.1 choline-sulfatase [Haladaptatus litoreus]